MNVHLVFVTKYRKKVFTGKTLETLEQVFRSVCEDFEAKLEAFKGERGRVRLLVSYPPKVAVARLVNSLKGVSSRRLRRELPSVAKHYWKGVLWSPSYFAGSCGGAPLTVIKVYVESQQRLHSGRAPYIPGMTAEVLRRVRINRQWLDPASKPDSPTC